MKTLIQEDQTPDHQAVAPPPAPRLALFLHPRTPRAGTSPTKDQDVNDPELVATPLPFNHPRAEFAMRRFAVLAILSVVAMS